MGLVLVYLPIFFAAAFLKERQVADQNFEPVSRRGHTHSDTSNIKASFNKLRKHSPLSTYILLSRARQPISYPFKGRYRRQQESRWWHRY